MLSSPKQFIYVPPNFGPQAFFVRFAAGPFVIIISVTAKNCYFAVICGFIVCFCSDFIKDMK
ncbi:MAG TPA: hypothetical protein DHU65_03845 [Clostridiales bacterium]|nr:hypothetical protein [Clostridiales bacterium]